MDTQKFESDALSDDRLDAVSGGGEDEQKELENSEQLKALETFGKALTKAGNARPVTLL